MSYHHRAVLLCTVGGLLWSAETTPPPAPVTVAESDDASIVIEAERAVDDAVGAPLPVPAIDAAGALCALPGAGVIDNGPLTGLAYDAGLSEIRLGLAIDGLPVSSACPNHMDPGLSHLPGVLAEEVTRQRGVAALDGAFGGLGASFSVEAWQPRFSSAGWQSTGRLQTVVRQADRAQAHGASAGMRGASAWWLVDASVERGDDRRFADGVIDGTFFDRESIGGRLGGRYGPVTGDLGYFQLTSGHVGTPALPMDMISAEAERLTLRTDGSIGAQDWQLQARWATTDHVMDNYTLRPGPAQPMRRRIATAVVDEWSAEGRLAGAVAGIDWSAGLGAAVAEHGTVITNPMMAAFVVDSFRAIDETRLAAFATAGAAWNSDWGWHAGLRLTRQEHDAGTVRAPAMAGPQRLADRFNDADRQRDAWTIDAGIELRWTATAATSLVGELTRTSRLPTYVERYGWLPLAAASGAADGRRYVGDLAIDPEVAHGLSLAVEHRREDWSADGRAFVQWVDDYITGVPATDPTVIMVSTANGDPEPLQWQNTEALLYGFELRADYRAWDRWFIEGRIDTVFGERRDIDDDLYRIAPPQGQLTIGQRWADWQWSGRFRGALEQDRLAASVGEVGTDAWLVLDLRLQWRPAPAADLTIGLDNLFDSDAAEHLSSVNRVRDSDVAVGERLPMAGRSVWLSLTQEW